MKKFAIILSGCGSIDGSEIHESISLMLSIKQLGADYQCFSINKEQTIVANSITGEKMNEKRNMLIESARIAKGDIKDLKDLIVEDFDAVVLPGGSGSILNLSTFKNDNNNYEVDKILAEKLLEFKEYNKIICAVCIAPMILAKVFKNITITIGNDKKIANIINSLGNNHVETQSKNICVDKINKIITAPFYMMTNRIEVVFNEAHDVILNALKL